VRTDDAVDRAEIQPLRSQRDLKSGVLWIEGSARTSSRRPGCCERSRDCETEAHGKDYASEK
jgi:hypothetical protein